MNTTQQQQQQQHQQMNQLNPSAKQMTKSTSENETTTEKQRAKLVSKASSAGNFDRVSTSNSSSLSSTGWCLTDTNDSTSSSTHESHPVNANLSHESKQQQLQQHQQGTKTLAFIEAQDNNEMLMVINMLKNQFPHINLHLCPTPNENFGSKSTESPQSEVKRETDEVGGATKSYLNVHCKSSSVQSPDLFLKKNCGSPKSDSYQYYRNSLSASSCYHTNSVSSIDNSSLSSNNTSFERQESKDSESFYVNKSSFDSGKGSQSG